MAVEQTLNGAYYSINVTFEPSQSHALIPDGISDLIERCRKVREVDTSPVNIKVDNRPVGLRALVGRSGVYHRSSADTIDPNQITLNVAASSIYPPFGMRAVNETLAHELAHHFLGHSPTMNTVIQNGTMLLYLMTYPALYWGVTGQHYDSWQMYVPISLLGTAIAARAVSRQEREVNRVLKSAPIPKVIRRI